MNRDTVIGLIALAGITTGFAFLYKRREDQFQQELLDSAVAGSNAVTVGLNQGVSFTRIGNFRQDARSVSYTIDGVAYTVSVADIADMPFKLFRGRQLDIGSGSTKHKIERDGPVYAIKVDNDNEFLFDLV